MRIGGLGAGQRAARIRARSLRAIVQTEEAGELRLPSFGLKAPVVYAKTSGHADLALNASTGVIAWTVPFEESELRQMSGTATGDDDCRVAWDFTLMGALPKPLPSWTVLPSISGIAQVGSTLDGHDGAIANGAVSARQWLRDGAAIEGATGSDYLVGEADIGALLAYRVTATGPGGTASATSAAIGPVVTEDGEEPDAPVIGHETGVFANQAGDAGQWYLDGAAIEGATAASWAPGDLADVYGRAVWQVADGANSNVIVLVEDASVITHVAFAEEGAGTKLSELGYEMVDIGGQAIAADERGLVTTAGILNNGSEAGPWGRLTGNLAGQDLGRCVALQDVGDVNHINQIDVPLTSISTSNPQAACPVVACHDVNNFVYLYVVGSDLQARRVIDGAEAQMSRPEGGSAYLRLSPGLSQHDRITVKVRLGAMQVAINDVPHSFVGGTGTSEPADYWLPLPQAIVDLKGEKIGLMARGGAGGRFAWVGNHWFGASNQAIIIGSATIYEETGETSALRGIRLEGVAWANRLNNAEVLLINEGTGQILADWQNVEGAPGAGTDFTIDVPIDLSWSDLTVRYVLRDTVHKNEAASGTILIPIYQTIFPYKRGINESFVNYFGANNRENNIFDASMFSFDQLTNANSVVSYATEAGLDDEGQVYAYPYDPVKDITATRVFFRCKPGLKVGDEYIVRYPPTMTASWWNASTFVEVLQAPADGTVRIKILRSDDSVTGLRLSGPIPPEGVGPKNVTMYRADIDPETAGYLGPDFTDAYEYCEWQVYRNMSADGLNQRYSYPRPFLNHAGQNIGPLSAKAWGAISHLNGGQDIHINLFAGMSDAFVLQFFEELWQVIHPNSRVRVAVQNEVWNKTIGNRIYKDFAYEGVTKGFHASPFTPIPEFVRSLRSEATNRDTGALKVPLSAGDYIYWDKNGVGSVMHQTLKPRDVGDIIDDSDPTEWQLVVSEAGSWNAIRRQLTRRTREIVAIADSVFPASRIIPCIEWQQGPFNDDRKQLFLMDDFIHELALRPLGGRFCIAPYWGPTLANWNLSYPWQALLASEDDEEFEQGMLGFRNAAIPIIDAKINEVVQTKHQCGRWTASEGYSPDLVPVESYELGPHFIVTPASSWPGNIANRYPDWIRHPYMGELNQRFIRGIAYRVGGAHIWFERCRGIPSGFNSDGEIPYWALMENEFDHGPENHRLAGVLSVV